MAHLVILTGTVDQNAVTSNVTDREALIRQWLSDAGFNVVNVNVTGASLFEINTLGIRIEVLSDDQYSAEQNRENVIIVLSSIPTDSYVFSGALFYNIHLSILSDNGVAQKGITDATTPDPLGTTLNDIAKAAGKLTEDVTKKAADNLTSNWSSPLVIGAVALGALFILKRK